jgi:FixJ family two-component response regulator
MTELSPVVYVVDDDQGMCHALASLFRSVGLRAQTFGSAREFLDANLNDGPACLVLDVRLPGLSGLELQQELTGRGFQIPIIFITGHADVPTTVRAMKAGAVEFLTKPCRDEDLLEAVEGAIARDLAARQHLAHMAHLRARYAKVTPREREVMQLVVTGMLNKQIAAELGTSEVTVKLHRGRVMHKMEAESVADLVRMADRIGPADRIWHGGTVVVEPPLVTRHHTQV